MANSSDYLKNYGGVPFTQMPFGAVDSFALCQSFYLPVETVYKNLDKEDLTLRELYMKAFELRGSRHKAVGVVLSRQVSVRAVELARSERFGPAKVVDLTDVFTTTPAVQFAAMTLELSDGTAVIVYRGTDDSIIGWKEDVDILVKRGMPSHQLAQDYLERIAQKYDKIVLCGHSKGGNLGLWAVLKCAPETRAKVTALYNLEGPGFFNYHLYSTPAYKEFLDRYYHIIPHGAFIGVMLAHDDDYMVVRAAAPSGPIQHDLTYWMVQGDHPYYADRLNMVGRFNDLVMKKIVEMIPTEYYGSIEKAADILVKGMGQLYLTGFVQHMYSSLKGTVDAWRGLDDEMKSDLKESFRSISTVVPDAIRETRTETAAPAPAPAPAPAEN